MGCTITQQVTSASTPVDAEICIIENPAVRGTFLPEYRRALHERGHTTSVLGQYAAVAECEFASTYTARWSWELMLYLAYAQIKVFRNGRLVGEAVYDATGGRIRIDEILISAESKIQELVEELFGG